MNKVLRLENTAPFQGLAELVAYDEGLFEKEGITIEWIDREKGVDKSPQMHITDHKDASRFASHGSQLEQGKADLYNACEWGNYSRVETTKVEQPPGRPPLHRHLCGARRARRFARCRRRSSSPASRSACRSTTAPTISRCRCWKASSRAS